MADTSHEDTTTTTTTTVGSETILPRWPLNFDCDPLAVIRLAKRGFEQSRSIAPPNLRSERVTGMKPIVRVGYLGENIHPDNHWTLYERDFQPCDSEDVFSGCYVDSSHVPDDSYTLECHRGDGPCGSEDASDDFSWVDDFIKRPSPLVPTQIPEKSVGFGGGTGVWENVPRFIQVSRMFFDTLATSGRAEYFFLILGKSHFAPFAKSLGRYFVKMFNLSELKEEKF